MPSGSRSSGRQPPRLPGDAFEGPHLARPARSAYARFLVFSARTGADREGQQRVDLRRWIGRDELPLRVESGQPTISQNSPIFGLNPREQKFLSFAQTSFFCRAAAPATHSHGRSLAARCCANRAQLHALIPSAPRDRPRPFVAASPCRSPARQASQAHCRDWSASRPRRAERARASFPSAPRDRPRPFVAASPCRSPARQASQAHCRDCSASRPSRAEPARASFPSAPRDRPRPPVAASPCRSPARQAS